MLGAHRHPLEVRKLAPAKVNLALSVGGPEPSTSAKPGFHRIASWMACIDLADEISIEPLPKDTPSRVEISWAADAVRPTPIDWPVEKDLAARAHRMLESHAGHALPARIVVTKRIPVGSGLGGGSSDAAATLLAVNEAFGLGIAGNRLAKAGALLGSDVAFFIDGAGDGVGGESDPRPALVSGFGDVIERVPAIRSELLLVVPPFSCPTAGVYGAYDRLLDGRAVVSESVTRASKPTAEANDPLVRLLIRRAVETGTIDPDTCFNCLTAPAVYLEPRVARVIEAVTAICGVQAHLTGSGSCIFVVGGQAEIGAGLARLKAALSDRADLQGCKIVKTRLV